jgi:hypothetical protein
MRYFTLEDWIADQEFGHLTASGEKAEAYSAYLARVHPHLPADFQRLLATICIHDAALRELTVDLRGNTVTLVLDAGDVSMREPRRVRLRYEAAREIVSRADPAHGLPGPHGYGDLGYDEIEVLEDRTFEHRLLFSTGIELAVRFERFRLEVLPPAPAEIAPAPQN